MPPELANRPPSPTLLRLAAPLMVSFTLRALLTAVDLPFGALLGDPAIAAMGLAFSLEFAFLACWVGLSSAMTSHLARAIGERREDRVQRITRATGHIVIALAGGFLLLAAIVYGVAPHLGLDPAVAENFRIYAPVILAGAGVFGFWSVIPDSIVKAHHDTRSTMVAGLLSGALNVVLNTLFALVLEWGIFGLALATNLARLGGLTYALARARTLEARRRREWSAASASASAADSASASDSASDSASVSASASDSASASKTPPSASAGPAAASAAEPHALDRPHRALLVLAAPTALAQALLGVELFVATTVLSRFPDSTSSIAAYAVFHRATMMLLMPVLATAVAVVPFVARAAGAGQHDLVRRGLRDGFAFATAYALLFAAPLAALLGHPVARLLGETPATEELAGFALQVVTPAYLLVAGPYALCRPAFEAMQRGLPGLIMALVRYLALSAPLGLLGATLAHRTGHAPFHGLLAGVVLAAALASTIFVAWLRRVLRGAPTLRASNAASLMPPRR